MSSFCKILNNGLPVIMPDGCLISFILPEEWCITYDAVFTADIIGSPFINNYTVGFFLAKNPSVTSYRPGATTKILVLSFSQRKLSGNVLTN